MILDSLQKQQIREWCDEAIEEAVVLEVDEPGDVCLPPSWVVALLDETDGAS